MRMVHTQDTIIGNGNPKHIPTQIIQDRFGALRIMYTVNDPIFAPGISSYLLVKIRIILFEPGSQLASDQFGQSFYRHQIFIFASNPLALLINAAAGHQQMDMGMIGQIAGPGMQYG